MKKSINLAEKAIKKFELMARPDAIVVVNKVRFDDNNRVVLANVAILYHKQMNRYKDRRYSYSMFERGKKWAKTL